MTNEIASTWIREALRECEQLGILSTQPYFRLPVFREALAKAITALENQPEPQTDNPFNNLEGLVVGCGGIGGAAMQLTHKPASLQCVCGWRTLDTHRLLCDSCGGHELKPVYEVGK
jgi:hypothetical protein